MAQKRGGFILIGGLDRLAWEKTDRISMPNLQQRWLVYSVPCVSAKIVGLCIGTDLFGNINQLIDIDRLIFGTTPYRLIDWSCQAISSDIGKSHQYANQIFFGMGGGGGSVKRIMGMYCVQKKPQTGRLEGNKVSWCNLPWNYTRRTSPSILSTAKCRGWE